MISKQSISEILLREISERENEVGNVRCIKRFESLNRIELEQELYKANCKIEILEDLLRISDERYRRERAMKILIEEQVDKYIAEGLARCALEGDK